MDGPAPRLEYVAEDVFNLRRLTLTNNSWPTIYDGLGSTIESAVLDAHKDSKQFFVKVVEEHGAFKT